MEDRDLAIGYCAGRVAIGTVLAVATGPSLRALLRDEAVVTPGVALLGRILGARDLILGAGALAALRVEPTALVSAHRRGPPSRRPASGRQKDAGQTARAVLRPWLVAGAAADASDAIATLVAYRHLPRGRRALIVAMALGGLGTGVYLSGRVDG